MNSSQRGAPAVSRHFASLALLAVGCLAAPAVARPQQAGVIPLWSGGEAGAPDRTGAGSPTILPMLPPPSQRTGAGILVISVGSDDDLDIAAWLNAHGIVALVLRDLPRRRDPALTPEEVNRALQVIRAHSADLGVAPDRIGVMGVGYSADLVADAVSSRPVPVDLSSADRVARVSSAPNFIALLFGLRVAGPNASAPAPTFLASSVAANGQSGMIDLWTRLRTARTPVDAHFFAKGNVTSAPWKDSFIAWARYRGFLTDRPRVAISGTVNLDGRPIPHGYVVFTPIDSIGAGPIVGRVLNSTAGVPIGQFTVPALQGPTPGRYRVEVHQNANRWLSNSFSSQLINNSAFGHSRILTPSLEDQRVYTKARPADREDYVVDIPEGGLANIRIEITTGLPALDVTPPAVAGLSELAGANAGVAAYVEQLKHAPVTVPGIPEPIFLWPAGAPGAIPDANGVFTAEDRPAILPFPAPPSHNTGAALLILPGGAFTNRVEDHEGVQIARWLNRQGISGFVVRYRIRPNYNGQISTADAHRAMRVVRAHAAEYGIAPDRIGVIGFSAGAELEGDAFFNNTSDGDPAASDPIDRVSAKSNFNALIYGGRNLRNPGAAPPTFMFVTLEDGGNHLAPEINVLNGLRGAGIPVEAHWYQDGPHGTSMSPGDPQLGQWPDLMMRWMEAEGLLPR
ncbi:MAG TPA: alpha/beta hydrolase [Terriglobia bacterium]|nr:alpha/beta hydrolase [Terriglobia bacterium]